MTEELAGSEHPVESEALRDLVPPRLCVARSHTELPPLGHTEAPDGHPGQPCPDGPPILLGWYKPETMEG